MTYSKLLLSIALLAIGMQASNAFADSGTLKQEKLNGVDITNIAAFLRSQIVTLKKPITVYNWSPGGQGSYWDKDIKENDPGALQRVNRTSKTFWLSYGSEKGYGSMYGQGLYAAVDPVVTYGFGGGNENWLLTQMQLPIGFRMLDLASFQPLDLSAFKNVLETFACPTDSIPDVFFTGGGNELTPKCRTLVKKIFQGYIDGFAYSYASTVYQACTEGLHLENVAFVVTDNAWVQPKLVKVFSKKTTSFPEDRRLIQTLFLETDNNLTIINELVTQSILAQLKSYPNRSLKGYTTTCESNLCHMEIQFCSAQQECNTVPLSGLPRPGGPLITPEQAQETIPGDLLWSDLSGQPKTKTVNQWLLDNKYGCSGILPYEDNK